MSNTFESINKILVVTIAHMGDVVLATPVTRSLKKKFPSATVDLLVRPLTEDAAKHNPYVDHVLVYEQDPSQKNSTDLQKFIHLLQSKSYDLALSLNNDTISAMLIGLSGARYRIGYENDSQIKFFTHTITAPTRILHQSERQLEILKPLGLIHQDSHIEFNVSTNEMTNLYHKLNLTSTKPIVVLCPFSSHWHKNWIVENWVTVMNHLAKKTQCILIGSNQELSAMQAMNAKAGNIALIAAGKLTLGESAALIKSAHLFITVDTGPMHIAQAFDTPVIALMGPTHSRVWGPRNRQDIVIRSLRCPCAPCWQLYKNYHTVECLNHSCMTQITATEVIKASESILNTPLRLWA
ncbi:MAG: rfaQ 1 [Firmicutes bacterium]|nr:rfaQ 1 [Bacillota bacterium]